jgi:hypothetical protein
MRLLVVAIALVVGLGTAYAQYTPEPPAAGSPTAQPDRQRSAAPATTGIAPSERSQTGQDGSIGVAKPNTDRIPTTGGEAQPRGPK